MAGRADGFALLEVLLAFVIAALALGALFGSGGTSLRAIQDAARYGEALSRARSRLALATHGGRLLPGEQEGEDGGGFRWRVRVTPLASTAARPPGGATTRLVGAEVVLYGVDVTVWWSEDDRPGGGAPRREVRLETRHVGPPLS